MNTKYFLYSRHFADIHVSANQHEESDTETFQLECAVGKKNEWAIRSSNGKYWAMDAGKQDILNKGLSRLVTGPFSRTISELRVNGLTLLWLLLKIIVSLQTYNW